MEENNLQYSSPLESFGFALRHPWIIVCSVIIIMNLAHAYVMSRPLKYSSTAILSFEMKGEPSTSQKFISAKSELTGRALLGENMKNIISESWPNVKEEDNPVKYNKLVDRLRSETTGIRMYQNDKSQPGLLTISFIDTNPQTCHNVVQSTVGVIKSENRKTAEGRTQTSLTLLNKQMEFYRNRLTAIEKSITEAKGRLTAKFPEMTGEQKEAATDVMGLTRASKENISDMTAKYEEIRVDLNLQLLELEKKREMLVKCLESDEALMQYKIKNPQEDIMIGEYSKAIAAKDLEMADLLAKGYKPDHPQVQKLQREINRLENLSMGGTEKYSREDLATQKGELLKKINAEISNIDSDISIVNNKIALVERYKSGGGTRAGSTDRKDGEIYEDISKLKEMVNERSINEGYYLDIRKQVEAASLGGRGDTEETLFRIVDIEESKVPANPIPLQRLKVIILGLMMSAVAGFGGAYVLDNLENSIKSTQDLSQLVNLPVLATVDRMITVEELAKEKAMRKKIMIGLLVILVATRIIAMIVL